MDVETIKHAARLTEWSERIQACRMSRKPVNAWCEENGINVKSYYLCMKYNMKKGLGIDTVEDMENLFLVRGAIWYCDRYSQYTSEALHPEFARHCLA